jgi:uncharacterized membrane protein
MALEQPPAPFPERDRLVRRPQPPADPLAQHLFPPDLVMRFRERIGLSNEQRQAIMMAIQGAQTRLHKLQQRLQKEMAALDALLSQEKVDLAPMLDQSDKVQDLEAEIKRTHLVLLVDLKNLLSPEQQSQLQELKNQLGPGGAGAPTVPAVIQEKMQRLQAGIQQWQQNGGDPTPIERGMQEFEPLIHAGQFKEAEAVLDHALKLLPPRAFKRQAE